MREARYTTDIETDDRIVEELLDMAARVHVRIHGRPRQGEAFASSANPFRIETEQAFWRAVNG